MNEKSDYVMLPPKARSQPTKFVRLRRFLPFLTLLVVVASVSWWAGKRSGAPNNRDAKQATYQAPEPVAATQLAGGASPAESAQRAEQTLADEAPGANPAVEQTEISPPPAKGKGGLALVTEPAGAAVKIVKLGGDETRSGATPLTFTDLPSGFYEITVERKGFEAKNWTEEVVSNRIREIEAIRLERSRGNLDIQTSHPARYELFAVGEEDRLELIASGDAPATIPNLPINSFRLAMTRQGWPTVSRDITLAAGMTTVVEQDFPEGSLTVTSNPEGAEVWIKAQHQEALGRAGVSPLRWEKLPVGAYEVVLKHSIGPDQRLLVKVEPGKATLAEGSWSLQQVTITSDPPGAIIYNGSKRLEGEDNPVTPFTTEMLEGRHSLYAVKPGLKDVPLMVEVGSDEGGNKAHFAFRYGTAQITSDPDGAEVFSNGRALGTTPLLVSHIAPGKHQFLLRRERYASREIDGLVRTGHRLELSTQLQYDPTPIRGQDFTNSMGQRMIWVAPLDCWVESTETTQRVYESIVADNPSELVGLDLPVNNVTWMQAVKFCEQLTIAERGQGFVPDGYRYHLPTDEQWSLFATGTSLQQSVTSRVIQRNAPESVASLAPNPFGLYDTRGNVWEWCRDWYTLGVFNREQQGKRHRKVGEHRHAIQNLARRKLEPDARREFGDRLPPVGPAGHPPQLRERISRGAGKGHFWRLTRLENGKPGCRDREFD